VAARPATDDLTAEERWRLDELRNLGLNRVQALDLIGQPDIAHRLRELVDSGCPPSLAYRILRE
jgi:hypothetical protein